MNSILPVVENLAHRISRLADPDSQLPRPRPHEAFTLASGYSGCALSLLYAGEILDDSSLSVSAQTLLRQAAETTSNHMIGHFGLFDGLSGFARIVLEFTKVENRYVPTLEKLADQLGDALLGGSLPEPGQGIPLEAYDVTRGVSGQLASVIQIIGAMDRPPSSLVAAASRQTDYLMRVTELDDHGRPGWLLVPQYYPAGLDWYWERSPHGMYNLGFAHGMPGILAALCTAASFGIGGDAVVDRVRELALWLTEHANSSSAGPTWPTAFNADPESLLLQYDPHASPARDAWCYGAPGVSLALLSASAVAGTSSVAETAVSALRLAYSSKSTEGSGRFLTLCHGQAGLAATAHRAARLTGLQEFAEERDERLKTVVAAADPARPFLFADIPGPDEHIDDPGFLTGAAGVLLSLLSPLAPARTEWDEMLFLTTASAGPFIE